MADISVRVIIEAVDKATDELKKVGSSLLETEANTNKVSKSFGELARDIQKNSLVATAGIAAIGAGALGLASNAGKFESVSDAFSGMAKQFNVSSESLITSVRKATKNTVSDLQILTNANTAMTLIGKDAFSDFGGQFTDLATIAKKAARATGQDVGFMFDSIVRGIGRASPLILDNLGLTLRAEDVYKSYGDTIGKSASELTFTEQKQAILNEVLRQGAEKYKDVAVSAGGLQGVQQELSATLQNLSRDIGMALLPSFNSLLRTSVVPFIQQHGPQLVAMINGAIAAFNALPKPLQDIVIGFTLLAPAIVVIGTVLTPIIAAFNLFIGVIQLVTSVLGGLIALLGGPLTVALIAIVAVISAVALAWKNNWFDIQGKVKSVIDWMTGTAAPAIASFLQSIGNKAIQIKNWFVEAFEKIRSTVQSVINTVNSILSNFRPSISIGISLPDIEGAWRSLKERAHKVGVPGFAKAGVVPGPRGAPQVAVVHGGERIEPATGSGGGSDSGGGSVNIVFQNGMFMGSETEMRGFAMKIWDYVGQIARSQNKRPEELLSLAA